MDNEPIWIEKALQGDDLAFGQLVDAYQNPVYNLCYRMLGSSAEAEDAAQETFLRAYVRLSSYDSDRKFSSWILAVASHYCIDQLRRRRFNLVSLDDLPPWAWLPDPNPQPEDVAARRQQADEVRTLLNALSADYRAAVVLRYWHEFSYQEIAEVLDTTVSAIKSRLFRARQMMATAQQEKQKPQPASNTQRLKSLGEV
jgi:RNA polymerase sigma-70 factor, ECF subfamily